MPGVGRREQMTGSRGLLLLRYGLLLSAGSCRGLGHGWIEMNTNTVERVIRPITLARKNALFAGPDGGARHWAVAMTLIQTEKLNGVEPMAWLTDVLERIVSGQTKSHKLHSLLPWDWTPGRPTPASILYPAVAA